MAFNRNESTKVCYINYIRNVHILKEILVFLKRVFEPFSRIILRGQNSFFNARRYFRMTIPFVVF